ncbi:MAG TPA: DUF975 family protein [Candidatus Paceibacterota bacterium]
MNTFTVGGSIRFGWETFKKRPWFFVGVTVITSLVSGLMNMVTQSTNDSGLLVAVGMLVSIAVGTLVGMGLTAVLLKAHDSVDSVTFSDLWHPEPFWSYLAASILIGIVVVIGIILLIIPGIILALMLMFTTYVIIDRKRGPIEAMKESRRITHGKKWVLLGLVLAAAGINIIGALLLLIGLLVTIPVTMLAMVHAYRQLEHGVSEVTSASA